MSGGALYRKYRSKTFKDVIGQEHITTTVANSIKNKTFSHAYLLTGPRGVGKTSVARLFAYEVNGLRYADDGKTYSDIIEIDAASNRRIDEIRDLREKITITPSALKYKVYIIDEVHMLTREAFNALLKTLEEPPEHAIFILATTDFHKVPDTIVSRCVRFAFLTIPVPAIKKHLQKIAKQESISIEEEALGLIAENSEGSFRDAISLLDQFRNSSSNVTAQYVSKVLGVSPQKSIAGLISAVEKSEPKQIVKLLDGLRNAGANDAQIVKQLIAYLRDCLIGDVRTGLGRSRVVSLIDDLLKINNYSDVRIALEVALLGACADSETRAERSNEGSAKSERIEATNTEEVAEAASEDTTSRGNAAAADDLWQSALNVLKNSNSTLYGIARMAEAKYDAGTLELYFNFPFHFKQMNIERNRLLIEQTAKSIDKGVKEIKLTMKDNPRADKQSVDNISNIFGSAEVLES